VSDGEPEAAEGGGWDPFAEHIAFVGRGCGLDAAALAGSRVRMRLPEAQVERARPMVDPAVIEALMTWQGVVAHPTTRDKEDYPTELQDALENCEAQFILRNIPRYEMEREPGEAMPYERKPVQSGLRAPGSTPPRVERFEPVEMLPVMNLEAVRHEQRQRRRLQQQVDWSRCFGREVSKDQVGPQWRNVPEDVRALLGDGEAAKRGRS
jgi:hypothetical protein